MRKQLLGFASLGAAVVLLMLALNGIAGAQEQPVPEIDPGTIASGVGILTGAALLLVEKFRRR